MKNTILTVGLALLLALSPAVLGQEEEEEEAKRDRAAKTPAEAPKPDAETKAATPEKATPARTGAKAEDEAKAAEEEKPARPAAPDFTLPDPEGKKHTLSKLRGKYVVLEWINHGCPYVKKHYNAGTMQALQKKYTEKGVVWLSICSSAPGKQGHMSAEEWKKTNADKKALPSAVLLDPDGKVGRLYKASRTPHMYVIDPKGGMIYQGAIDDRARAFDPAEVKGAKSYVSAVLDAVLAGKASPHGKTTAYGCSVKYR